MKIRIVSILALAAIAGCGGGGGSQGVDRTRIISLLQSGVQGIGTLPSPPDPRSRPVGGRGLGGPYYDDAYHKWCVDFESGDPQGQHSWGTHFFLEEELTTPAGGDLWDGNSASYPHTENRAFAITAGDYTGLEMTVHRLWNEDDSGSEANTGVLPYEGSYELAMSWIPDGLQAMSYKFTDLDGVWNRWQVVPNDREYFDYTITGSLGITFFLSFALDTSGDGTISGNAAGLPATLEWDSGGNGTIHWSDGSTTTFENWEFQAP
jgi:hypothetical protein